MPHFFFFLPIQDSTEEGAFPFWDFLEHCPRGEKKSLHHLHVFVFLGVHFTAFSVLEHVMNAVFVLHRHKV